MRMKKMERVDESKTTDATERSSVTRQVKTRQNKKKSDEFAFILCQRRSVMCKHTVVCVHLAATCQQSFFQSQNRMYGFPYSNSPDLISSGSVPFPLDFVVMPCELCHFYDENWQTYGAWT